MKSLKGTLRFITLGCMLALPMPLVADVELAQKPLFVGHGAAPNLLFILDDSGSMAWRYMPDDIRNDGGVSRTCVGGIGALCLFGEWQYYGQDVQKRWFYSSHVNKVYFDPSVTYRPPLMANGTRKPNSSYTAAWTNGYSSNSGTRNLTTNFDFGTSFDSGGFYYQFKPSVSGCEDNPKQNKCYDYVSVNSATDEVKQNFANWYSYYRTRLMASKAGIGEAFSSLPAEFRLGWGAINSEDNDVDDVEGVDAVTQGVRGYDSAHRTDFYNWLYGKDASGGTPLLKALNGAGTYYETSLRAWVDNPDNEHNISSNPARQCRQAYTILMTDGYYTDSLDNGHVANRADDVEGEGIVNPKGTNYQYEPANPFTDGRTSTTLADVAMYYWKRDLWDDDTMANFVPTTDRNPAYWQHMVTYGVGLGVTGSVDPETAFSATSANTQIDWWGGTNDQNKLNDLLHAAVNSRGGFFSAADPTEFAEELVDMIGDLAAEAGTATGVEFNVSSFQEGGLIFAAEFDPNSWIGDLKAVSLGELEDGESPGVPNFNTDSVWSAADKLDERDLGTDARTIITYADGAGAGFLWANLSNDQKADLKYGSVSDDVAQQRLNYIRGDRSQEGQDGFRRRASRLGAIINSSPEYVGSPKTMWPDTEPFGGPDSRYSSFVSSNSGRTPVVYVGASDGMLHGFKATTDGGEELLAYIPSFVYSSAEGQGLHYLVQPNYQHRYYVDLPLRQQDIYTKGRAADGGITADKSWRSVLVGGGRAGAKGIFALDVTNPGDFTEANAKKLVLWEFSAANDNRLGYNLEPPVVALANWGAGDVRWTVFVANGYNSTTASTGFFMLDLEAGLNGWDEGDYRYVEFSTTGGGLSPLTVLDTDGDYVADRIYAGDLSGNLWVAEETGGSWASAYSSDVTPQALFVGTQPITSAPAVAANKSEPRAGNEPNLMVFFGTGQYLEADDVDSDTTQSIYGIWDRGAGGLVKNNLAQRTMETGTVEVDGVSQTVRYSTGTAINFASHKGWYVDLPTSRERVIHTAQTRGGFLYINSMIPDQNPCESGGSGWLMAFGLDGRTPAQRPFLRFPVAVVGYQIQGLPNPSTIIGDYRYTPDTKRDLHLDQLPPVSGSVAGAGRRGWAELVE